MELVFFLKGVVIGFVMAVPIGPVGIMYIRKTLAEGRRHSLLIGLAAATADGLFGCIAAFGLTFVSDLITSEQFWLRIAGGTLLVFIGIRTVGARRTDPLIPFKSTGSVASYVSALLLALTNPVTIFAFVGVFAAFGFGHALSPLSAVILVLGVIIGTCAWFLLLGYVATIFRTKLDTDGLGWVNRISGVLIICCGIAAFVSIL
jgi:threonine/homoserine/homoserine lactone efflux protein